MEGGQGLEHDDAGATVAKRIGSGVAVPARRRRE
jgi:hypothetical protein